LKNVELEILQRLEAIPNMQLIVSLCEQHEEIPLYKRFLTNILSFHKCKWYRFFWLCSQL